MEKERSLTEAEIEAIEKDENYKTDSSIPAMTTAPQGAPLSQVESGMREADSEQRSRKGQYAEGGSLAQELKREQGQSKVGEPLPQ